MIQEDKDLLLKDLCGRLSYGLKVYYKTAGWEDKNYTLSPQVIDNFLIRRDVVVKPYLRTLSSMTEEEKEKLLSKLPTKWNIEIDKLGDLYFDIYEECMSDIELFTNIIDWLNAHHFDYRGLIPKCLAIEVTKENNPYL